MAANLKSASEKILLNPDLIILDWSLPDGQGLDFLMDLRKKEFYEKPTTERKLKKVAAIKRHNKRVRSQQLPKKLY